MRNRLSWLALAAALPLALSAQSGSEKLENVRLIDGTGKPPVEHATITIRNGVIASITTAASKAPPAHTVIPGLINAHGHLGLVKETTVAPSNFTGLNILHQLVQYEDYGVTTVMSLGMNKDSLYRMRAEQGKGNEPGATILTAGRGIGVNGGMPPAKVGKDQLYRPKTADEARSDVREMAAQSPNIIKVWVDDSLGKLPKMNPELYAAVIDEAHRANLKVAAHVFYLEDAKKLVQDGVDILAHSVRDKPIDADTISLLKSKHVFYIPTLQLEESFYIYGDHPAWMDTPFFRRAVDPKLLAFLEAESKAPNLDVHRKAFQTAVENTRKLHVATIPIGMGTDSGANPYRIPGLAEHRELELLVDAGLSPLEAIHSATQVNAAMFGIDDKTGTIEKGKQADLIVLDADPSKDILNTRKIASVFHHGIRVKSASITP